MNRSGVDHSRCGAARPKENQARPPRRISSVSRQTFPPTTRASGVRQSGRPAPVPIEFGALEWGEEVERYRPRSTARTRLRALAKRSRPGNARLDWKRCKPDGPGGTKLPGCRKLYVPLDKKGPSEAIYGHVRHAVSLTPVVDNCRRSNRAGRSLVAEPQLAEQGRRGCPDNRPRVRRCSEHER